MGRAKKGEGKRETRKRVGKGAQGAERQTVPTQFLRPINEGQRWQVAQIEAAICAADTQCVWVCVSVCGGCIIQKVWTNEPKHGSCWLGAGSAAGTVCFPPQLPFSPPLPSPINFTCLCSLCSTNICAACKRAKAIGRPTYSWLQKWETGTEMGIGRGRFTWVGL